jgi:DNA-binding NtrC family response regulator
MAVEAMRSGAHDFLQKPIQLAQLEKSILRALEIVAMRRELAHLRNSQHAELDFVVGKSSAMHTLLDQAYRAAAACVSVLITGETGTGKEILARAIHSVGPRGTKPASSRPFVAINCAAIQPTVLESELFGYEAGAFTGADKRKHGLLEIADGGILFLDEISSMPVDMQAKLLRVLEERAFRRVGGTALIHVDIQLIAASNRDLQAMMADGRFREDLYSTESSRSAHPAAERPEEDIPEMVGLFICQNNPRMGLNISGITPRALEALKAHHWPGNIRELRNVVERAMLFCDDPLIDISQLPPDMIRKAGL